MVCALLPGTNHIILTRARSKPSRERDQRWCAVREAQYRAVWIPKLNGDDALDRRTYTLATNADPYIEKPETKNVHDFQKRKEVNDANYRARIMFQNVTFKDARLQVVRYIVVPSAAMCFNTSFIVVVHMRAEDHAGRKRWRATYGNPHLRENFKYNLIFSIGLPRKASDQDLIIEESGIYGDILQADYIDAYRNITLKQLAELRFFASSCENLFAVVKLDDDVAWGVNRTAEFVSKNVHPNELYCAKSITKEEWGRGQFPTHCLGMIYIVSLSAIKRMLATIDDVFITGVLTEASNVTIRNIEDIIGEGLRYPEELYFREKLRLVVNSTQI
ncbi:N-acetyllactosaminide 3-alpha-galactosyltransferase [Ancylostoma ceylanicum]|uniref:Hexosyltransferase n=1 Tax=Ancylostoma ceylanicum TaxID=53326 RepID=A0A0D6LPI9_9BILA|nr:N-acetyllactosaminide 3-alpha-galactosyltransferase [Ancylostoma ceylanicum]